MEMYTKKEVLWMIVPIWMALVLIVVTNMIAANQMQATYSDIRVIAEEVHKLKFPEAHK